MKKINDATPHHTICLINATIESVDDVSFKIITAKSHFTLKFSSKNTTADWKEHIMQRLTSTHTETMSIKKSNDTWIQNNIKIGEISIKLSQISESTVMLSLNSIDAQINVRNGQMKLDSKLYGLLLNKVETNLALLKVEEAISFKLHLHTQKSILVEIQKVIVNCDPIIIKRIINFIIPKDILEEMYSNKDVEKPKSLETCDKINVTKLLVDVRINQACLYMLHPTTLAPFLHANVSSFSLCYLEHIDHNAMDISFDDAYLYDCTNYAKFELKEGEEAMLFQIKGKNAFVLNLELLTNSCPKSPSPNTDKLYIKISDVDGVLYFQFFIDRFFVYLTDQLVYSFNPYDFIISRKKIRSLLKDYNNTALTSYEIITSPGKMAFNIDIGKVNINMGSDFKLNANSINIKNQFNRQKGRWLKNKEADALTQDIDININNCLIQLENSLILDPISPLIRINLLCSEPEDELNHNAEVLNMAPIIDISFKEKLKLNLSYHIIDCITSLTDHNLAYDDQQSDKYDLKQIKSGQRMGTIAVINVDPNILVEMTCSAEWKASLAIDNLFVGVKMDRSMDKEQLRKTQSVLISLDCIKGDIYKPISNDKTMGIYIDFKKTQMTLVNYNGLIHGDVELSQMQVTHTFLGEQNNFIDTVNSSVSINYQVTKQNIILLISIPNLNMMFVPYAMKQLIKMVMSQLPKKDKTQAIQLPTEKTTDMDITLQINEINGIFTLPEVVTPFLNANISNFEFSYRKLCSRHVEELEIKLSPIHIYDATRYLVPADQTNLLCEIKNNQEFNVHVVLNELPKEGCPNTTLTILIGNVSAVFYMQYFIDRLLVYFMDQLPYSFSPIDIDDEYY